MIMIILETIAKCIYVYSLMIFVRCLLTWLPNINWENPVINAFRLSVDIYLDLFRKFIPPLGAFDVSPMVAMFALVIGGNILLTVLQVIFRLLGLM